MNATRFVAVAAALALAAACASAPADPNAPRACVTIDNSDGGGAAGQVYLVKDGVPGMMTGDIRDIYQLRGERIRLGEVAMGRSITECIQRQGLIGTYQIVVLSPSSDRIDPALNQNQAQIQLSETFRLNPGDEISWNVRLNRIRVLRSGGGER